MFKEIFNGIIKIGLGEYEIGLCFLELTVSACLKRSLMASSKEGWVNMKLVNVFLKLTVSACLKRSEGWVNMKSVHVFWNELYKHVSRDL